MELKRIVKPFAQRSAHIILPKELIGKEVLVYTKQDKVIYTKPMVYTNKEKGLDPTTQERMEEQAKQQEEINSMLKK